MMIELLYSHVAAKNKAPNENINSLELLTNYISPSVYDFISECNSYDAAITKLDALYIKETNQIFARHQLATRKQSNGEDLSEFLLALKTLSKACKFTAVTAEIHAEEAVRDAFISGLQSQTIRTRLLENA